MATSLVRKLPGKRYSEKCKGQGKKKKVRERSEKYHKQQPWEWRFVFQSADVLTGLQTHIPVARSFSQAMRLIGGWVVTLSTARMCSNVMV